MIAQVRDRLGMLLILAGAKVASRHFQRHFRDTIRIGMEVQAVQLHDELTTKMKGGSNDG